MLPTGVKVIERMHRRGTIAVLALLDTDQTRLILRLQTPDHDVRLTMVGVIAVRPRKSLPFTLHIVLKLGDNFRLIRQEEVGNI